MITPKLRGWSAASDVLALYEEFLCSSTMMQPSHVDYTSTWWE